MSGRRCLWRMDWTRLRKQPQLYAMDASAEGCTDFSRGNIKHTNSATETYRRVINLQSAALHRGIFNCAANAAKTTPAFLMMLCQVSPLAVALALSILSLLASNVGAHQTMMVPKPAYVSDDKETRHNPVAFLENQNFSTQLDFQDYMKKNKYSSLRDFMDNAKYTPAEGADFSCGFTKSDAPPEPIPKSCSVRSSGYTHDGPCALYLDDVKIYEKANCHTDIPGKEIQVDYSSCKGTCMLRWYWLGIRTLKNIVSWQVYKICVPLKRDPKDEICGAGDGTGQR